MHDLGELESRSPESLRPGAGTLGRDAARRRGRPVPARLPVGLGALVWFAAVGVTGPEPLAVGSDSPSPATLPGVSAMTAPRPVEIVDRSTWMAPAVMRPPSRPALGTVVLDPGHGGPNSPGTIGRNGLREDELTLDIAGRLAELLEDYGFSVVLTRRRDTYVSLGERARRANDAEGDIFVSIHVNWLNGTHRGVETFLLGPAQDGEQSELEEHGGGERDYSPAVLGSVDGEAWGGERGLRSRRLAEAVHRELDWYLAQVEPGMGDRGVKTAPFVVLMGTEMPAILAEVSTLSHPEDARLLELDSYREYIALALYSGIRSYSAGLGAPGPAVEARQTSLR